MADEVSKLPPLQQIGWLNVNSSTFYKLAELAATPRNQTLIDAGRIIRVYGEGSDPWESCRPTAALSADRGVDEYNAQWLADVRRCLEDVATEMRATGRSDSRFVRLIECMPRTTAVAAPVGEVQRLRECVAFFASVIKSGEQWSDACQHAYDMAIALSGRKSGGQ